MSQLHDIIDDIRGQRVLVCPLNWGLGHATRCVPIVKELLAHEKTVILAAEGQAFSFLKKEFPELQIINFQGINANYGSGKSQVFAMLRQVPKFLYQIWREHRELKKIIAENNIETVVSDNRFGLWNKRVQSIYITHQLMVKMPMKWRFLEKTIWRFHGWFIKHYQRCWIPDDEQKKLSGDLAHKFPLPQNARFIGILSRFSDVKTDENCVSPYQTIALISGPEPQRTLFENQLIAKFQNNKNATLIVRGLPSESAEMAKIGNITFKNHLETNELAQFLSTTPNIICRSGYSNLMDLTTLNRTATLVPTSGQTEQEYLAEYVQKFGFSMFKFD